MSVFDTHIHPRCKVRNTAHSEFLSSFLWKDSERNWNKIVEGKCSWSRRQTHREPRGKPGSLVPSFKVYSSQAFQRCCLSTPSARICCSLHKVVPQRVKSRSQAIYELCFLTSLSVPRICRSQKDLNHHPSNSNHLPGRSVAAWGTSLRDRNHSTANLRAHLV